MAEGPKSRLDPEFGKWLRGARKGLGLTVEQFADHCGLGRGSITDLENLRRPEAAFTLELFVRVANGLNIELGYVLHKAGFDIGADGINLGRLKRVEAAVEAFAGREGDIRLSIAEALDMLDRPPEMSPRAVEAERERNMVIADLGLALAALDLATERLRREGFAGSIADVLAAERGREKPRSRPWTERELDFLRRNPTMPHDVAATELGRSNSSVRFARKRLREEAMA